MNPGPAPSSHLLLLTACISPKPEIASLLRRSDPAVRLADYQRALGFWLKNRDHRIGGLVFADNSGHPLDSLRELARREAAPGFAVEFHSFDYPAPPPTLSYGHPELQMVNATLAQSPLAERLPYFAKVTGRYLYPGLGRLLDHLPHRYKVALDTTGRRPWPFRGSPLCNFGLALFNTDFYRRKLADLPGQMRPAPPWDRRQFVESMLYDRLSPLRHDPEIILRWRRNCEPVAIGGNGVSYQSPRRRCVATLRAISRRLTPGLWL